MSNRNKILQQLDSVIESRGANDGAGQNREKDENLKKLKRTKDKVDKPRTVKHSGRRR